MQKTMTQDKHPYHSFHHSIAFSLTHEEALLQEVTNALV